MTEAVEDTVAVDRGEGLVLPPPADPAGEARRELAEQLVEQARAEGIELVGPDGLLGDLAKLVLETGLEAS